MKIVHDRYSLDSYSFSNRDQIEAAIKASAKELLISELAGAEVDFPVRWKTREGIRDDGMGGAEVDDPFTMYLILNPEGEEALTLEFNLLAKGLAGAIEWCAEDGSFSYGLGLLSERLKRLSEKIDQAIEAGGK